MGDDHLYVMQVASGEIKVGRSANPVTRLKGVRQQYPQYYEPRIILVGPGMGHMEKTVHRHLWHYRLHGEWFQEDAIGAILVAFPWVRDCTVWN